MIITTARQPQSQLVEKAYQLSSFFGFPYIKRSGASIDCIKKQFKDDVIVVGKERVFVSPLEEEGDMFFHPNLAMVRAKRLMNGKEDPLISTAKLKEGMSFLDCTLGLAADSIITSLAVGANGKVTGIEGNHLLYFLTAEGLGSFSSGIKQIDQAMGRIEVVHSDHFSFLQRAESKSYDVVYLDPMFHLGIEESNGINGIRGHAYRTELTVELITEAKRVAKKRVVLKDHWKSDRFAKFAFIQHKRKSSLFHYGTIEV